MPYQFFNKLLLRSPFYSFKQYDPQTNAEILLYPDFQTALFLASPSLYQILAAKEFKSLSPKELLSVWRYYNRMSFRPTPFGSFSSFSAAKWGTDELLRLDADHTMQLHIHTDQGVVLQLAEGLTQGDPENHSYVCNPSLYRQGKEFRFIKTSYTADKKQILFDLESYEYTPLTIALMEFCAGHFKLGVEIMALMATITGCDRATAKDYLNFLSDAQIIIPDTAVNIVGEDYIKRLLNHPEIMATPSRQFLQDIYQQLQTVLLPDVNQLIRLSERLRDLLPVSIKETTKQFFYAGLERKVAGGSVAVKYQSQVLDGLKALNILVPTAQPPMLQQFIRDFKSRYDRQKVPLLQAVDPESGIGYGPLSGVSMETDLLRKVNFKLQKEGNIQLEWTAVHQLLLRLWNNNLHITAPIVLNDEDLLGIPFRETLSSPPTLSVLFRILGDTIYLENVGGVSATALIGRFTAWSEEVQSLSQQLALIEQSANPDVIFAEIGQLSDTHADNINRRNHTYTYEIPVNVVSTLAPDHQIALSDLWVSVEGDQLILESRSMDKVIVPRLSSAYNYVRNNLAVFRLLCDLQYQGLQGSYAFDLEQYFPGMAFYPRVTFKKTILSPATWHLSAPELKALRSAKDKEGVVQFKLLSQRLRLPAIVALSQFDQQLVFNTEKNDEIIFLLECLRNMDRATIQEFFLPVSSAVTNNRDEPLVNQFLAFLYKEEKVYAAYRTSAIAVKSKVKQEYLLGSKWLYLKIYCRPAIVNDLLAKKLLPLLQQFDKKEVMSWFFIRYIDSGYHIRLRLLVREVSVGPVLTRLKNRLTGTVHYHLIREYQADTYRREMERYGPDIIHLVERFFYGSSELMLHYIKSSRLRRFKYTYHSMAFVSVAYLLNNFLPDGNEQLTFLTQMVNSFYAEFSTDKSLKIDLDQKYRELKAEISELLNDKHYFKQLKLTTYSNLFEETLVTLLKATAGFTADRKNQLLADLIHMHLNRLFVERQRNQELVVYFCLHKHRLSINAMANKNRSVFPAGF